VDLQKEVRGLEPKVEAMNGLVSDEKYRKAGQEAEALRPRVETLKVDAERARLEAKKEAETAVDRAAEGLAAAAAEEAETYAASDYGSARSKLDQARKALEDPCGYHRSKTLALEAAQLASRSASSAITERRRIEEERRRAEEEARLREEERLRRAKPATYTVEEGDSLWRISRMQAIYGDPILWPVLYEANQERIRNPDLIYPGQGLQIPRGTSEDERRAQALRFYRTYVRPAPE
jgi:nucleoid-associated protein YgaU